jgi:predicted TIM-barrel fold metal-dependent hydrolase
MIGALDVHTHLPGTMFGAAPWPTPEFLAMLDGAGIARAVVMTVDGIFGDFVQANDRLVAQARQAPDRLIPFCTVDPYHPHAVPELRRAVLELGCRGLKLHPPLQGFSPLLDEMQPIAAEAARLGIPILFHDGTPPYSTPLQIASLLDDHPDLTVILGHGGRWDLWHEAVAAVQRYAGCYICLCGVEPPAVFAHIIRRLDHPARRRVMVGTDVGWGRDDTLAGYRMATLRSLLTEFSPDDQQAILYGNAARLLGVDDVPPAG